MLIATISSGIARASGPEGTEYGTWEIHVHVSMGEAAASGDPKGFCQKEIARHLAGCVAESGIPLREGMWAVAFSRFAQSNFNFPAGFIA